MAIAFAKQCAPVTLASMGGAGGIVEADETMKEKEQRDFWLYIPVYPAAHGQQNFVPPLRKQQDSARKRP